MEPYSTLDHRSPADGIDSVGGGHVEANPEGTMQPGGTARTRQTSVSAALAAAGAHSNAFPMRFPGDDGGGSLAEVAQSDLDAALQLLADRAQYITGAGGAAIALRRSGKNDLLCRASSGTNAPELGALLSTEFGLSGESVRTRQPLCCDDAERDARVNREVCRELGIASVVVMPVVNDDQVLGVFELFSGKVHAFGERDLSALHRLSEMVETAVRLAHAAESLPQQLQSADVRPAAAEDDLILQEPEVEVEPRVETKAPEASVLSANNVAPPVSPAMQTPAETAPESAPSKAPVEKRLFWSAALSAAEAVPAAEHDQSHVPPVLRNLRKCEACGFPVSAGRALCVECEEKKWRGQLKPRLRAQPLKKSAPEPPAAQEPRKETVALKESAGARLDVPTEARKSSEPAVAASTVPDSTAVTAAVASEVRAASAPAFVFSAGLEPSQSWFSANKYILLALLSVGAVIAAVLLLR
jgi:GAF domain